MEISLSVFTTDHAERSGCNLPQGTSHMVYFVRLTPFAAR